MREEEYKENGEVLGKEEGEVSFDSEAVDEVEYSITEGHLFIEDIPSGKKSKIPIAQIKNCRRLESGERTTSTIELTYLDDSGQEQKLSLQMLHLRAMELESSIKVAIKNLELEKIPLEERIPKHRNPVLVVIFTLITFGLYSIYWIRATTIELRKLSTSAPNPWLLLALFIPIVSWVVSIIYAIGYSVAISDISKFNVVLLVVLWIVFWPAAMIISQIQLNKKAASMKIELNSVK